MIRGNARKFSEKWVKSNVFSTDPHPSSLASLTLLMRDLSGKDKTRYTESRMRLKKEKWMKMLMKFPDAKGGLTCKRCGKRGLLPKTSNKNNLATLDHIVPLFKGGEWDNPKNWQVLCYPCANIKSREENRVF